MAGSGVILSKLNQGGKDAKDSDSKDSALALKKVSPLYAPLAAYDAKHQTDFSTNECVVALIDSQPEQLLSEMQRAIKLLIDHNKLDMNNLTLVLQSGEEALETADFFANPQLMFDEAPPVSPRSPRP